MAMYYSYGQRPSPSVDRWYSMDDMDYMITGDERGANFLTFVLRQRENPGKYLNQDIDSPGDRTWARCVRSNDVTPTPQQWSKCLGKRHTIFMTLGKGHL